MIILCQGYFKEQI